jgi:transcriptional regulator of acetoin/glycerol metabolism
MSLIIPEGIFSRPEDNQRIKTAWQHFLNNADRPGDMTVRPSVDQSWRRCLDNRVDPGLQHAPKPLTDEQLQAIRHRHRRLFEASLPVMNMARELMVQSGNIVLLADSDGMVMEAGGDYVTLSQAEHIHLMPGSPWHEQSCGTNAIGTALLLGQPVQIHGAEHFCEGIKRWTCSATVIRDPRDKRILGALDVSGNSHSFSRQTLAMTVTMAQRIESELTKQEMASRYQLLDLGIEHLAAYSDDGLLLFDPQGSLVRCNLQSQAVLLARGIDLNLHSRCQLPALELDSSGRPVGPLPVWLTEDWLQPILAHGHVLGMLLRIPRLGRSPKSVHVGAPEPLATDAGTAGFELVIGNSPAMLSAVHKAQQLAGCDVPVLLQGETGVGKEAFARGIHASGISRNGPFVAINCGSLSRELLASELFGYAEGAFTGARRGGMKGKIEAAHGGTLFLDEIGEMPLDLQSHLLRVLEESEIYRLGECWPRHVKFRLVTATHRDLRKEVANQRFRQDLFYRVAVTIVRIPPLRERHEDIRLLAAYILNNKAQHHGRLPPKLSPEVQCALMAYDWPGNVRELRNVLECMLLLGGQQLLTADLPDELRTLAGASTRVAKGQLEENERDTIRQAIEHNDGNLTRTAKVLGIAKSTLYHRLRKYNLQ